jgi:hypothetical protein
VDRALAVPDELCWQGSEPRQAAVHAPGDVGKLLGEDERPGESARVGKLGGHDPAATGLAPADRDLPLGLAEIELDQLTGAVVGSLEAARRRQVAGADLAGFAVGSGYALLEP